MNDMFIKQLFPGLCSLLLCTAAGAQLRLANALQSKMVVQQNKPLKLWGSSAAGDRIRVKADWSSTATEVIAEGDGAFMAIIDVPVARPGDFSLHQIQISSPAATVLLDSLLIGDVWFCSGQSNMQFSLREDANAKTELPLANYPAIRLLRANLNFSAVPLEDFTGKWELCTPETASQFSAVGYSFGKELHNELNIPIGLIFSGIGASAAQAFVPQDRLQADTQLNRIYLQPYLNSEKSREKIDGGFSFEKVTRPFLLYNAMIHPFRNLSISGFCWYQGESNRTERASYTKLTQTLIEAWRQNFEQGQLPFYYVQVAPFFYDREDPALNDYAYFREAQEQISTLNNTGMVVTMDVGEAKDLHPKNKLPIGWRLAQMALNRTYAHIDKPYLGPQFEYLEWKGDKAIVHFKTGSVAGGLRTNNGQSPAHFQLAAADGRFYPASASIQNNQVVVSSLKVKKPVALRYAFTNYPVTNLENGAGFPAVPFRTDQIKEEIIGR